MRTQPGDGPALKREIGLTGSALLSFNGIVGAGIFALPATLALQFGSFSPWLFPMFGAVVLLIAIPLARLASCFPETGGPVAYTAALGRPVSFQVGWVYFIARVAALAANANVFATYAAALWPPLGGAWGRALVIAALIGGLTWVNMVGVRRAIRTLDAVSVLKALPLVGLNIIALAAGAPPEAGQLPEIGAVESAALITLYAFVGFENSVVPAGETRDAQRNIPRGLILTVVGTALLYALVQTAYVRVMPAGSAPDAPLAAMAEALIGPIGILLLSLTAMASVGGNLLSSLTSTPRVLYALGTDRQLPAWFERTHPRWRTPANAIAFMGLVGAALALSGSFVWLAVVSTLARLFVYSACLLALPVVERRHDKRLGWALKATIAGGLLVCVWAAAQSKADAWLLLGGLLLSGLLLFAIASGSRRRAA